MAKTSLLSFGSKSPPSNAVALPSAVDLDQHSGFSFLLSLKHFGTAQPSGHGFSSSARFRAAHHRYPTVKALWIRWEDLYGKIACMAPELLNPRGLLTNIASASLVMYSKLDLLRVPCTVAYSYVYIYLYEVETASDEIPSTNEAYAFKY
jgi:hypothetical protein